MTPAPSLRLSIASCLSTLAAPVLLAGSAAASDYFAYFLPGERTSQVSIVGAVSTLVIACV